MIRQTSIEAYQQIKDRGLLSKRRWEVYDVVYHHGPLTAGEIGRKMPSYRASVSTADRNIHARLSELRKMGVLTEVRERDCTVTGMRVIEWDVTDKLPVSFEKPVKTKCRHCNGRGFYLEEQVRLF